MESEIPVTDRADPVSRNGTRKFTKEFKEAVCRRVEQGTPLKKVARTYNVDAALVRQWRDAWRDAGPDVFAKNGQRKFTKEFKEAAARRVEQGTPVKEVARACRVTPHKVRQWRDELRERGAEAFRERETKKNALIFSPSDRVRAG